MRWMIGVMLIVLFLFTGAALADKKASCPEILKPESIRVYEDELFINEGPSIFIYSLKDCQLKKKFGKQGEGPREFKLSSLGLEGHKICFRIFPDSIFVSSEKKISYFSRKGEFIKEKRIYDPLVIDLTPLAEAFVGRNYKAIENIPYFTVDLYNREGKKIKEICKHQIPHYKKDNLVLWQLVSKLPEFKTDGERIFVAGGGDFIIDVYNSKGEKIKVIKQKYKKRGITDSERKKILDTWKRDYPFIKRQWDVFKKMINIPGYFPAFRTFTIADKKIYVQTCNIKEGKTGFVIFDLDGRFIRQVFLPLRYRDVINHFPYTIDKNMLYQLVESEDTEAWELYVTKIN
ncbi:MAG: hypothetical protein JSV88_32175 [Candidatus Aminicenantes bacterium]|nr:MAG: hypothetical protein JSV88_32175 [Candidatus Aminicenantes bacterium]